MPSSPKKAFTGSLVLSGRKFPLGQSLADVTNILPEFIPMPGSFNIAYPAQFGSQNALLILDERGVMQSISFKQQSGAQETLGEVRM